MRTFALLAAIAAIAVADKSDFPHDDAFHADCHVTAEFNLLSCETLFKKLSAMISRWDSPETSPAQGTYTIHAEEEFDYIWSTRHSDDQIFEFTPAETSGCVVAGHSRSQYMSYYDYSGNFCNLWNVYHGSGQLFT